MSKRVAIILAAGMSTRMNTRLPKVLHEVCGRAMLSYVLDACRQAGVEKMYVVVGYGGDQVKEHFAGDDDDIQWVTQKEQNGTAHAVMCTREYLEDFDGETLVLCGDAPLIRAETLDSIIERHDTGKSAATLATAIMDDPAGYGRVVRDAYGNIQGIVEHNDCDESQLAIKEVNPSYYLFDNKTLFSAIERVKPDNVKNEYYLTDVISIILSDGLRISAVTAVRPEEAIGVNSREQLSTAGKIMQQRIQKRLMEEGVTIVDPDNTWIDARTKIGQDTIIEPFTYIHGSVEIGDRCRVGPFAYLREGTVLKNDVVLGVFTEVKNTVLCNGVRARHHSYLGDARIGERVNIGAGTITANYDGEKINRTEIGDDSYIGSGATIVAPIKLGSRTNIESGSVVSNDGSDKDVKGKRKEVQN